MTAETVDGYLRVQQRAEVARAVRALYRGVIVREALRLARGDCRRMRLLPPTLAMRRMPPSNSSSTGSSARTTEPDQAAT